MTTPSRSPFDGEDVLGPPQAPDELGRLGPYRVLRKLGEGGMGLVFLAEDTQLRRQVALKVLRPELAGRPVARERFLREARATAAIENDHIVAIHQVGEDHGTVYVAMALLRGESLEEHLRRVPRPALAEVLRIGREIALGLAAAHERGVIHAATSSRPTSGWRASRAASRSSTSGWSACWRTRAGR
jgi:serine/threonine protein kinase